jgi:transcriptional regulator with XRE-family HTH domain
MARAGLSDADLASALKVSSSMIWRWKTNDCNIHPLWLDAIRKLCGSPTPFMDSIRPRSNKS